MIRCQLKPDWSKQKKFSNDTTLRPGTKRNNNSFFLFKYRFLELNKPTYLYMLVYRISNL